MLVRSKLTCGIDFNTQYSILSNFKLFSENEKNDAPAVENDEKTQCRFDPSSLKILYVINSENCFYRKKALQRAKSVRLINFEIYGSKSYFSFQSHKLVSIRKTKDFSSWHKQWLVKNVTQESHQDINNWFLGHSDNLLPNKTRVIIINDDKRSPYHQLTKYKCEIKYEDERERDKKSITEIH